MQQVDIEDITVSHYPLSLSLSLSVCVCVCVCACVCVCVCVYLSVFMCVALPITSLFYRTLC